jgi:hypothetical protein
LLQERAGLGSRDGGNGLEQAFVVDSLAEQVARYLARGTPESDIYAQS